MWWFYLLIIAIQFHLQATVQEYSYIELYTLEYHYPDFALLFHLFKRTLLTLLLPFLALAPVQNALKEVPF